MSRLSSFADAVHVALNDATVEKVLYRRREARNGKRRRIHWYSEPSRIAPPHQAGGRVENGNRSPAVWSRYERVACMVFAEDWDNADTLLDNLIVAITEVADNGSAIFEGYTWDYDQVAQRVPMVELIVEVQWPVLDEVKPLTVITDEELTCEFE